MPASTLDLPALQAQWRSARPFPHVVLDGLLSPGELAPLGDAFSEEPLSEQADEHFAFHGGAEPPQAPPLRSLADWLGSPETLALVSTLCGQRLGSVGVRAYTYARGHYLLPHSDWQQSDPRVVAFAWYLALRSEPGAEGPAQAGMRGGALELFDCTVDAASTPRGVTTARKSGRIAPKEGRLVLFAVSPAALHQVREVTRGERCSLAGWFRP
jgi:hypothetical protein